MEPNISQERYDELEWLWSNETSDLDTMDWRDELTEEESQLVASWDKAFNLGIKCVTERIWIYGTYCRNCCN